jgi:hypothetical protein
VEVAVRGEPLRQRNGFDIFALRAERHPKWSGCVGCIGDQEGSSAVLAHLAEHEGDCAIWACAHTHARPGTVVNGRELRTEVSGCHFVNCAGLTKHHGKSGLQYPRSRIFEFTNGSNQVVVRNWYHDDSYAPAIGYYGNPITLTLPKVVAL